MRAFRQGKKSFYVIFFIYIDIITEVCNMLLGSMITALIGPPGRAGEAYPVSELEVIFFIGVFLAQFVLILLPTIILTIKAKKEQLPKKKIVKLWIFVVVSYLVVMILLFINFAPFNRSIRQIKYMINMHRMKQLGL